ncbi:ABC transporter permease subunit [Pelolinea submarina]|uniref:ABC-type dipeptide/oligopeptide/nickel transport system permease subunit n=1 Tax=Pelolinea submarina TaxID=913107 RepID=A0A347ZUW5_9CHLR|nr:ABC transporter permease subunit [Pelolinea submarina]REG10320.1 ABC-type dipeptide/oligopeptide/nickel transport system permease subunit [Pelolinea submarina]BBB49096.1 peptide/nickel transport system permease protein [Pelolinea submarina]
MENKREVVSDSVPEWQLELDKVGWMRKMLLARKWYGGDWWFVVISAVLLLFIITVGVFPQWFAPFDPREEVGPSLLAPGEEAPGLNVLVLASSDAQEFADVATKTNTVGYLMGSPATQTIRDTVSSLNDEAEEQGLGNIYQPRSTRFETLEEGLASLSAGEIDAFVASEDELGDTQIEANGYRELNILSGSKASSFVLGTNQIGQDILSRIIWGTRIALIVGLISAIISFVIGVPLGLISGFIGGTFDRILTLFMDSLYTFPGLILAIAIASVLGAGIGNIIVAISVLYIPTYFRIVRGQTLSVKNELYVEAARSLGTRPREILFKYIFPNVLPSVVIIFSVNVADAILTEAGLSFIGLGLPPDTPDWGIDLARGQDYLRRAWWLITFPGIMVTLVTLSFSMLGESLSEILNPRLAEL